MIGLGSNRLTVCRRGGMSVTQAGRGGMEWLAGGREPLWSSPYSAQATAALKAQFPTQWPTIRDYGWEHPEIVPFVNQYPMAAPYVMVDGLSVLFLCDYECSAASWKDLIGNKVFAGKNVVMQDGVPYFGSTAYYVGNETMYYPWASSTIEVVYKRVADGVMFMDGTSNGSLSSIYTGFYICSETTQRPTANSLVTSGDLAVISYKAGTFYENGRLLTNNTEIDRWNHRTYPSIGCRYTSASSIDGSFEGKIYAIRIYNRLLTEQEILANQAIDLQRWQPS